MGWWWKKAPHARKWEERLIMRPGPQPEPAFGRIGPVDDLTADDLQRQAQRCDDRADEVEAYDPLTQSVLLETAVMLRVCAEARRPRGGIQGQG